MARSDERLLPAIGIAPNLRAPAGRDVRCERSAPQLRGCACARRTWGPQRKETRRRPAGGHHGAASVGSPAHISGVTVTRAMRAGATPSHCPLQSRKDSALSTELALACGDPMRLAAERRASDRRVRRPQKGRPEALMQSGSTLSVMPVSAHRRLRGNGPSLIGVVVHQAGTQFLLLAAMGSRAPALVLPVVEDQRAYRATGSVQVNSPRLEIPTASDLAGSGLSAMHGHAGCSGERQ